MSYELGVKTACQAYGASIDAILKLAASMPPVLPSAALAAHRLRDIARGVSKPAGQMIHSGMDIPLGVGRQFHSAMTPDVLARLGGGI